MSLVCTSVSGVAEGHFVVGRTYKPDSNGRLTTQATDDTGCQVLRTAEKEKIYAFDRSYRRWKMQHGWM